MALTQAQIIDSRRQQQHTHTRTRMKESQKHSFYYEAASAEWALMHVRTQNFVKLGST